MIRRFAEKPGAVFLLVFVWKVALLLFTAQPVPNNDAFFYDGPVVNYLLNGKYCNPSLIHALPISGGDVFCAYPPIYQLVLLGWMRIFGPGALSAMWLHLAWLGIYFLIVLAIFRRLGTPGWIVNLAGLFLFGLTFHDRPDTVAHVFGMMAVFGMVRGGVGIWWSALALVFAFATSLQIGGIYLLWCVLLAVGLAWSGRGKFPLWPFVAMAAVLVGLVAVVRFGAPHLWAGFQEHARITPFLAGLHRPNVLDLLKAIRTAPGLLLVVALLLFQVISGRLNWLAIKESTAGRMAVSGAVAGLAVVAVSLVALSANTIHIANYFQPIVVGAFLSTAGFFPLNGRTPRCLIVALLACSLVTGLRAVGMSTWGVWCARDVSRSAALSRVRAEVDSLPAGSTVIASSAYLYDLARYQNLNCVHSDWPAAPGVGQWETPAYARLRPTRIIVTQFDYYRRFGAVIEQLRSQPGLISLSITRTAHVRPPDSFPKLQRFVQHVSWAPVIVELQWR